MSTLFEYLRVHVNCHLFFSSFFFFSPLRMSQLAGAHTRHISRISQTLRRTWWWWGRRTRRRRRRRTVKWESNCLSVVPSLPKRSWIHYDPSLSTNERAEYGQQSWQRKYIPWLFGKRSWVTEWEETQRNNNTLSLRGISSHPALPIDKEATETTHPQCSSSGGGNPDWSSSSATTMHLNIAHVHKVFPVSFRWHFVPSLQVLKASKYNIFISILVVFFQTDEQ
jgi:hypothetical protein